MGNTNSNKINETDNSGQKINSPYKRNLIIKRDSSDPSGFTVLQEKNPYLEADKDFRRITGSDRYDYFDDMPYYKSSFASSEKPMSENMDHLTIEYARTDGEIVREKYAIHKDVCDHDCGPDCHCIKGMIQIVTTEKSTNGSNSRFAGGDYKKKTANLTTSEYDPDLDSDELSETSDEEENEENEIDDVDEDDSIDDIDDDDLESENNRYDYNGKINTEDLITMQRRIYESSGDEFSETSDFDGEMQENTEWDEDWTDEVSRIIKINNNSRGEKNYDNMYDSEDQEIMDMNSTADKINKRKVNRSTKYR